LNLKRIGTKYKALLIIYDYVDFKKKKNNSFFVAAETKGLRQLVFIINHLMFSVFKNFEEEYIGCINFYLHLVLDCEFVNDR